MGGVALCLPTHPYSYTMGTVSRTPYPDVPGTTAAGPQGLRLAGCITRVSMYGSLFTRPQEDE